jgi:hypothetical protein
MLVYENSQGFHSVFTAFCSSKNNLKMIEILIFMIHPSNYFSKFSEDYYGDVDLKQLRKLGLRK